MRLLFSYALVQTEDSHFVLRDVDKMDLFTPS